MSDILDHLRDRVLLCDGGMGTQIQSWDLSVSDDFQGYENCTDYLCLSRPDVVREIHRRYFAAGADMVETNSFGASPLTLAEFGMGDVAFELNKCAAEIAREAAESFSDSRKRFVLGSIGPGTKLPSLGQIGYDVLEQALVVQSGGLIAGGVDAILIETCQDLLQIKAAVNAVKIARAAAGTSTPAFVQMTLPVGADIAAAASAVHALDVPLLGLNCATGPQGMNNHVRWLSAHWRGLISVQPNAGLPEQVDGKTVHPLKPDDLAVWQERFLADGINLLGGCCGTTPTHIAAVDAMLRRCGDKARPAPARRSFHGALSAAKAHPTVIRETIQPVAPFWGTRVIDKVPLQTLMSYLNPAKELKPLAVSILKHAARDDILVAKAVYGYWKCYAHGDAIVLVDEEGVTEIARFDVPRQAKEGGIGIAAFLPNRDEGGHDVIGLQVVTMGSRVGGVGSEWFAANGDKDCLHGLSMEMTEAMAEYVHARIRSELGFAAEDARDIDQLLHQEYRGSRYSPGCPACPNRKDQEQLLRLLGADRIGVTLNDEGMLEPKQSQSAIVISHPRFRLDFL